MKVINICLAGLMFVGCGVDCCESDVSTSKGFGNVPVVAVPTIKSEQVYYIVGLNKCREEFDIGYLIVKTLTNNEVIYDLQIPNKEDTENCKYFKFKDSDEEFETIKELIENLGV